MAKVNPNIAFYVKNQKSEARQLDSKDQRRIYQAGLIAMFNTAGFKEFVQKRHLFGIQRIGEDGKVHFINGESKSAAWHVTYTGQKFEEDIAFAVISAFETSFNDKPVYALYYNDDDEMPKPTVITWMFEFFEKYAGRIPASADEIDTILEVGEVVT